MAIMPKIYPNKISSRKKRLLPFADLAVYDLIIETGHESPKQISINISKISAISIPPESSPLYHIIVISSKKAHQ